MSEEEFPNTLSLTQEIGEPWGQLVSCLSTSNSKVLNKPSIKAGRADKCDIVLEHTSISKEHCIFSKELDGKNYVTDLSKNGTFINGLKIGRNNRSVLKHSDKITLGKDSNVYIFQLISNQELPDTLTSASSSESPVSIGVVTTTAWGRLISCLLYLNSFDLHNPIFKVGRSSQCDAVIDTMDIDPIIKSRFSKEHFVIVKSPDSSTTVITDLSKGGTFLNGRLIGRSKSNILQHDDTISIGPKRTRIYVYKSMSPSDANYLPLQLRKKYEMSHLLGKGGCGEVRLAFEKLSFGYSCQLLLLMLKVQKPNTSNEDEIYFVEPFMIHMKEIVETEEEVFLVLEYMRGGELNNRILSNEPFTESDRKFLFYQMILAVQFLHLKGITHRDLKPENVLLSSESTNTIIKVSDFGLSKVTEDNDLMRTTCGTLTYMAPEVLDNQIPEYDRQVDVWSLGVILFYMLSKELPFQAPKQESLKKLIISGEYTMDKLSWNGVSYLARDLVRKMLTVNPKERITISAILCHPWLANDVVMRYRVKLLLENEEVSSPSENADDSYEIVPPKRIRLSSSDESG